MVYDNVVVYLIERREKAWRKGFLNHYDSLDKTRFETSAPMVRAADRSIPSDPSREEIGLPNFCTMACVDMQNYSRVEPESV